MQDFSEKVLTLLSRGPIFLPSTTTKNEHTTILTNWMMMKEKQDCRVMFQKKGNYPPRNSPMPILICFNYWNCLHFKSLSKSHSDKTTLFFKGSDFEQVWGRSVFSSFFHHSFDESTTYQPTGIGGVTSCTTAHNSIVFGTAQMMQA